MGDTDSGTATQREEELLRSGSLLHPLNRERLRQSLRQRPLEELQEELSTIQQALASASGIVLRTRGAHADLQPDSSESEADQSENGIGRAQPPVAEFVGRRPIFRVVRVEDAVSPAGSVEKDEAKLCGWLSSRVESPEDSWEDMPFDKDTAIVAALADLSPRQILKARHVASNPIASTQELHQSTPVLSICDEGSVAVRGYVGLEVDPSPPHAILGIGLMDVNGILQGEEGYANPCIEQGDRLVAIDGHECVLAPMAQVERLMTGEVGTAVQLTLARAASQSSEDVRQSDAIIYQVRALRFAVGEVERGDTGRFDCIARQHRRQCPPRSNRFGDSDAARQAASVLIPTSPNTNIEMRDPLRRAIADSETEVAMLSVLIPRRTSRSPPDAQARQDRHLYQQARSEYLRVVKSHTLEEKRSAAIGNLDLSRRMLQTLKMRMEQTQARWSQTNQVMGRFQRQEPSARVRSLEAPTWMLADLEMRQARLASIRSEILVCEEELASIDAANPSDASRLHSTIGRIRILGAEYDDVETDVVSYCCGNVSLPVENLIERTALVTIRKRFSLSSDARRDRERAVQKHENRFGPNSAQRRFFADFIVEYLACSRKRFPKHKCNATEWTLRWFRNKSGFEDFVHLEINVSTRNRQRRQISFHE